MLRRWLTPRLICGIACRLPALQTTLTDVRNKYLAALPPATCQEDAHYASEHRILCDLMDEAAYWVAAGKLGAQAPQQRYRYANLRSLDTQLSSASNAYWTGRRDSAQNPARQESMPRRAPVAGPPPDIVLQHLDRLVPDLAGAHEHWTKTAVSSLKHAYAWQQLACVQPWCDCRRWSCWEHILMHTLVAARNEAASGVFQQVMLRP
jgi:hypothetical protein